MNNYRRTEPDPGSPRPQEDSARRVAGLESSNAAFIGRPQARKVAMDKNAPSEHWMVNPTSPMQLVPVMTWEGKSPRIELRQQSSEANGFPHGRKKQAVRPQGRAAVPAAIPLQSMRASQAARCKISTQREADPVTRPLLGIQRRHKNDPSDPGLAVLGCIQPSALNLRARPGDRSPSTDYQKLERACPTW